MSVPSRSTTSPGRARTLVLCFDGTAGEYDATNTNVVKLFSLLKKDSPEEQLCYYQAGIGTYFQPGVVSPLLTWFAKIADEAVAWYLDQHVIQGYTFLMQNYRAGDKICLFGFSRGAYTARALAGMLHKVGLLGRDNPEQVPFAYKIYKRTDKAGIELSAGFKKTFARSVTVELVGVWETVCSVGLIMGKNLPFTNSNSAIKTFRQALALDEHRAKFQPNLYHRPSPNPSKDPEHASSALPPLPTAANSFSSPRKLNFFNNRSSQEKPKQEHKGYGKMNGDRTAVNGVPLAEDDIEYETDTLEVWFAGCHSDVGGGSTTDTTVLSLSQITLHWMVREIMASQSGVLFDEQALELNNINPTLTPISPVEVDLPELAEDTADAVQPLYDPLKQMPLWWIVEIVPTQYAYQDGNGRWEDKWNFHLGRGRQIPYRGPGDGPKFHVTVKERMDDQSLNYKPKAVYTAGTEVYVQ